MPTENESNAFYAWFANHYADVFGWRPHSLIERWEKLGALLRQYDVYRVLDAACGVGRDTMELARQGFHVQGFDLSPEMIGMAHAKAAEQNLTIDFSQGDLSIPPPQCVNNPFDAVLCMGNSLLHAANFKQFDEWVNNLSSCVKPGGIVFLQVQTIDHLAPIDYPPAWALLKSFDDKDILFRRMTYRWDIEKIEKGFVRIRKTEEDWVAEEHVAYLQMLRKSDIDAALCRAGIEAVATYAHWDLQEYIGGTSDGLFIVGRKRAKPS